MKVGKAFSFPFQDPDWIKKILIGGLVSLIPIVGSWMVYGFAMEIARDAYNDADETMPEWNDLGGYLVRGLLLQIGFLIWLLPLAIAFAPGFLIAALVLDGNDVAGGILLAGNIGLLFLVLLFWMAAILPIVGARYAIHREFGSMFEFRNILTEIRRAGIALLIFLLIVIAGEFVGSLGLIVCFVGVIFTSFYAEIVIGHAAGQLYRVATEAKVDDSQGAGGLVAP